MSDAERDALTMLCAELEALREECARHSDARRNLLARIETEASARRPILGLLSQLLGGSQDETRAMVAVGLPGFGAGRADQESFVCPDGACDRVCVPVPAGPLPSCALTAHPMKRQ
ncbi:hypothetical protein [Nocardia arizonensis]|uniref:hypothetical protein n=1 Tax=Nocardia arizonensis TaxID=1141647 RepID=UPI0012E316AA|nr:hypothetical protein [Nocardia arizonensis]